MADSIERRAEYRYQLAVEFLHPALILTTGGLIGLFCVGMFVPLTELVNRLS
jgi:type II secretory pathway component PulF